MILYNKDKVIKFLDKAIIFNIYIYALGSMTSKALISTGMGFSVIFWTIKLIILRSEYKFNKSRLGFAMLLFSISILFSGIDAFSREILNSNFYFSFLFFAVVINELKNKKTIKKMFFTLLFSSIISVIYGYYEYFFANLKRADSFTSSLALGNFMAVYTFFFIIYIFWGKNIKNSTRVLFSFFSMIYFILLLLTKTRGAWLAFIFGIIVLGLLKDKRIIIVFLILLLTFFIILPEQYINRFKSSFNIQYNLKNNRSNSIRIGLWMTSIKMFLDHPINGVGYDQYKNQYISNYKIEGINPFSHAHNNILQIVAELGLFGLLSFVYLMWMVIKNLIYYYKNTIDLKRKLFHLGSILTFLVYHIQGLTQYNFGDTEPLHFFWFIIALNFVVFNFEDINNNNLLEKSENLI
ncbi:O-antigen ligase [Halanaerobium sp. MA284_MarDTE_T2]|uniref:O-antigen ligase family protein n=1 Tax=Halanaerobium sp. MA284_MarDTE_T2 TaxID=2183913 RepID=UPI000DF1B54E|nr:O-antigen ligase family protein [Halanaerobium sp. MA284_MarDTE_T2]RCW45010.1 O-antigen ligase [Halanaerobium sp. MA284_MarDTE_T2]